METVRETMAPARSTRILSLVDESEGVLVDSEATGDADVVAAAGRGAPRQAAVTPTPMRAREGRIRVMEFLCIVGSAEKATPRSGCVQTAGVDLGHDT
jgi:hypothetical protein